MEQKQNDNETTKKTNVTNRNHQYLSHIHAVETSDVLVSGLILVLVWVRIRWINYSFYCNSVLTICYFNIYLVSGTQLASCLNYA